MAKKRKQYVAHISKARSARAALKDLAIGFCANNDEAVRIAIAKSKNKLKLITFKCCINTDWC